MENRESDQSAPARLLLDVSALSRWAGPVVGIIRMEWELAHFAADNINNVTFVFFDPESGAHREVNKKWIRPLVERTVSINPWTFPSRRGRRRRSDRIPVAIRPMAMWVLQLRRNLLLSLEHIRLSARSHVTKTIAEKLQRPLISGRYRPHMVHDDGTRRSVVSFETFLGPKIEFTSKDTLVFAGTPWEHLDIQSVQSAKERAGFRLVIVCHDIIPLLFPHFYKDTDVNSFREYYSRAFPLADLVVFIARAIERDALAYCKAHHLRINQTCVIRPGADALVRKQAAALPQGIEPGRYALLVSTIEPRKGHQLIYNVWLKLLEEGIPQSTGFQLVFVGRPGWKVEELLDQLRNDARLDGSFHLLTSVNDDQLAALYEGAAFCLYPSVYEGYGLPIVEAFSRNKALLASTGGAIPEVVAGLSPCLDPHDELLWHAMLKKWIVDPRARISCETDIRSRFRMTPWASSARQFFETVQRHQIKAQPDH